MEEDEQKFRDIELEHLIEGMSSWNNEGPDAHFEYMGNSNYMGDYVEYMGNNIVVLPKDPEDPKDMLDNSEDDKIRKSDTMNQTAIREKFMKVYQNTNSTL
uniref:Uncharacterized protein n=2 Tax=Lotharella globosa TaxID=91324 RepID=A0A6V3TMA6_9EUKA